MDGHDELENRYMPRFEALASESGLVVEYRRDRAGIDTGLHLFEPGTKHTAKGEAPYWRPLASRVWFQLKGRHKSTLSAEEFAMAASIPVSVEIEHLKYWFAAPEPVYLVVYVESVDTFIGVDVRDMVENRWGEGFYPTLKEAKSDTVTVHVPTSEVFDAARTAALTRHRSMRIDGPAFRGRPLGHRYDPLRSVIAQPDSEVWVGLVRRLLEVHDFRENAAERVGNVIVILGILAQTLLWQSPAFAEYGYSVAAEPRDEPQPEQLVGHVCLILDTAENRTSFTDEELDSIRAFADASTENGLEVAVFIRDRDLSSTGGLWRRTLNETALARHEQRWRQIGLEAVSHLMLVTTLVYLDVAPDIVWDHVNYL